jgi:hypothetical protein
MSENLDRGCNMMGIFCSFLPSVLTDTPKYGGAADAEAKGTFMIDSFLGLVFRGIKEGLLLDMVSISKLNG